MNIPLLRSPWTRYGAAALLAAAIGIGLVSNRTSDAPKTNDGRELKNQKHTASSATTNSASSRAGFASARVVPTESEAHVSRAMDKTMARSLTLTFVEVVDRKDDRSAERLRKSLIAYKDISREVIDELRAREPRLSEAAKVALQEVYEQAH